LKLYEFSVVVLLRVDETCVTTHNQTEGWVRIFR